MASRTFSIAPVSIPANEVHSAARPVPITVTKIDIQLVDGGAWNTTVGRFNWGLEVSKDGGATWEKVVGQWTDPDGTFDSSIAIGSHDKAGGMPSVGVTRSDLGDQLVQARLFAWATTAVTVGATIVAST